MILTALNCCSQGITKNKHTNLNHFAKKKTEHNYSLNNQFKFEFLFRFALRLEIIAEKKVRKGKDRCNNLKRIIVVPWMKNLNMFLY